MRVSSDRQSPHYSRFAYVKLDGRPLALCLEADDVAGTVDVMDLEALNDPEFHGDTMPVKHLHGFVEIELAP